jgi:glutathione S-transferase
MKLYGTTTSPFVRRVRAIAAEVGEPVELVNTAGEAGQALLREVSPIRKVPVARFGDRLIYDSQRITDWLIGERGWGTLAPPADAWAERNLINALDEALLSIVQVFFLRRDGLNEVAGSVFEQRQWERADAIFAWAKPQLRSDAMGIPELSVVCALDWMEFRPQWQKYATERAGLEQVRAAFRGRPSLAATAPQP